MAVSYRPARASDLERVYHVWYAAAHPAEPVSPAPLPALALFRHEMDTGTLWVAEDSGELIGYGGAFVRSAIVFVADLFVLPDRQAHGIGRALLTRLLETPAEVRCTMSSLDPKALTLYARAGLRPRWPNIHLVSRAFDAGALPGGAVAAVAASPDDPTFLAWDARVSGMVRPEDHGFLRQLGASPLWFVRAGAVIGYGYGLRRSVRHGTEVRVGPLGAGSPDDAAASVGAALRWAESRGGAGGCTYRVAVPAAHAALRPLLDAGFVVAETEIFCCDRDEPFLDPRVYLALAGPEGTSIF